MKKRVSTNPVEWFAMTADWLCTLLSWALVLSGLVNLGISVYQFAFFIVPAQMAFRATMQVALILIGTRMFSFQPAVFSAQLLFSTCALVTAGIGLLVGSWEMAVLVWDAPVVFRMGLYGVLLSLGYIFSPMRTDSLIRSTADVSKDE